MDYLSFVLWLVFPLMALNHILLLNRRQEVLSPPGPFPLPIIGNLFELGDKPHKSLAMLAQTYGPLMCLKLGRLKVVVVSSASMANEVLQKNDGFVTTRPVVDAMRAHRHHEFSILCLPAANRWRILTRICNTQVFSSSKLDATRHLRQRQVEKLLCYVSKCCNDGVAVEIGKAALVTSLNFLSNAFFSVDLTDYSSDACTGFKQLIWAMSVENGKPNLADFFPLLKRFDPQGNRRRMETLFAQMMDLVGNIIDQRLHEPSSGTRDDLLDALIKISQEKSEELEHLNILHFLIDLLVGGTETTSSTVEWAMVELLRHPDKLTIAKAELDHFIGKDKPFQETDVSRLPYFQAIMKEIFRMHPASPILPRQVDSDIEISGFRVPKSSRIWINIYAIGRDPGAWENPNSFEPERFLGSEITVNGRDFKLAPFGGGRRICPGFPLAMRMLPLTIGSLIHSFHWKLENGADPRSIDMDDKFGTTLQKAEPLRVIPMRC